MTLASLETVEQAKARWVEVLRTCEAQRELSPPGSSRFKAWDEAAAQARRILSLTIEERTLYWKHQEARAAVKFEGEGMTSLWNAAVDLTPVEDVK